jgi:hypothetical protein
VLSGPENSWRRRWAERVCYTAQTLVPRRALRIFTASHMVLERLRTIISITTCFYCYIVQRAGEQLDGQREADSVDYTYCLTWLHLTPTQQHDEKYSLSLTVFDIYIFFKLGHRNLTKTHTL